LGFGKKLLFKERDYGKNIYVLRDKLIKSLAKLG
jgi:hypothetical protein